MQKQEARQSFVSKHFSLPISHTQRQSYYESRTQVPGRGALVNFSSNISMATVGLHKEG